MTHDIDRSRLFVRRRVWLAAAVLAAGTLIQGGQPSARAAGTVPDAFRISTSSSHPPLHGVLLEDPTPGDGFQLGDIIPPAAPHDVAAHPGSGVVTLTWAPNTETDLAGYNLYRSTSQPVPTSGAPLNSTLLAAPVFNDRGVANDTTYFYAVTAVDTSGNRSQGSIEVGAMPLTPYSNRLYVGGVDDPTLGLSAELGAPDFTVIVLPDTQYYSASLHGGSPAIFNSQTQWIVNNRVSRNIVYVAHVGDIVENGDSKPVEWQNADAAMSLLENPTTTGLPQGIPFGLVTGNHDHSNGTTTLYNQHFGETRFLGRTYYGGHYGSNSDNHYELFSANGLDFIAIHFGHTSNPSPGVLGWANNLLQTYPDRRGIVVAHNIIGSGFNASFSSQGQAIYNALRGNPNYFLNLSGHIGEGQRTNTYNGNTVWSVMQDYQGRTNGGNGWLRIFTFSPANNEIRVQTYSPWLNQFETDPDSQFTIPYDMSGAAAAPTSPTAAFSASPTSGVAPFTVYFTDQSTGDPTGWLWDFGDGSTSALRHPSHTYATPGVYTVTLTATNPIGSDDEIKNNYVTATATTPPGGGAGIVFANLGASAIPDLNDNANLSSYSTASWTPPTTGVLILFVQANRSGGPDTPSVSGNGLTWVRIGTTLKTTGGNGLSVFLANAGATTGTTGSTTIAFGSNKQTHGVALFAHATGVDLSAGVAAAVVQQTTRTGAGTSGSLSFAAAANPANRQIVAYHHQAAQTTTHNAAWTELDDVNGGGLARGVETQVRSDAFSLSSSASWSTSSGWGAVGLELKAESSTPVSAPDPPTNVMANAISSTRIDVTWTASSSATGYRVERSTDGGASWTTTGTTANTTFNDTGRTPGATCHYQVFATIGSVESDPSVTVSATTPTTGGGGGDGIVFANLGASGPPDLNNSADATSYATASWTPPTSGLLILFVQSNRSGGPDTPTVSGNGVGWAQIGTTLTTTSGNGLSVFLAGAAGATTGPTTIAFGSNTQTHCVALFAHATGVDLSTGVAGAVVQRPTGTGTGTSGSLTFAAAAYPANRQIVAYHHLAQEATTPHAAWTELDDVSGSGRTRGVETQVKADAFSLSSSGSWSTSSGWGALGLELKAAGAP